MTRYGIMGDVTDDELRALARQPAIIELVQQAVPVITRIVELWPRVDAAIGRAGEAMADDVEAWLAEQ